jgi:Nif-specific regulatory protein
LKEIKEDIPLLASSFLLRFGEELKRPARHFTQDALAGLTQYDWPGNVRELENEMKRIAATIRHETVQVSDLSPAIRRADPSGRNLRDAVEELERGLIRSALKAAGGNRLRASEALGLSRQGLLKKMQRYGIS